MKFSIGIPTCMEGLMYPIPFMTVDQIIETAIHAEKLGYDSVWGNDHITTQAYVRKEYSNQPNFWEPLIVLSAIAQHTTNLRLGTGVLVPAMRQDIVVLAKQIATLDHLSHGRFILGAGIGAYREEFEALHPGRKVNRGALLEESLFALRQLFTKENATWEGKSIHYESVDVFPKPLQNPLPFFIGGNNPNSISRAAQLGQGWLGAGMPVWQMRNAIKYLDEQCLKFGRGLKDVEIAPEFCICLGSTKEKALKKYRESQMYKHLVSLSGTSLKDQVNADVSFEEIDLVGTSAEVVEKIRQFEEIGVQHICASLLIAGSAREFEEQMTWFAEEVFPQFDQG